MVVQADCEEVLCVTIALCRGFPLSWLSRYLSAELINDCQVGTEVTQ